MAEDFFPDASTPPTQADAQDPLPEPGWFFRRMFVFALTAALLALVWVKIDAVADVARQGSETAISGLVSMLRICLSLIGLLILFYLLAPSAEQLTRMIQTVKALRSGVGFRSVSTATGADGGVAQTRKEAGPAPLPPEPKADVDGPSTASGLPGTAPDGLPFAPEPGR